MLSKTREHAGRLARAGSDPDTVTGPLATAHQSPARRAQRRRSQPLRVRRAGRLVVERFRRKAHRTRLHGYAIVAVALVAFLIALAASNTAHVKVNWVFGSSHVSLVWLVLFAAILGWLLGLATSATFHWRTRAPRRRGGGTS